MRYFDLHCDTLSKCVDEHADIVQNDLSLDIERLSRFDNAYQTFAAFIHDDYKGAEALGRFNSQYEIFYSAKFDDIHAMLSIENMSAAAGDIDNIYYFSKLGVKIASLTWNGKNELASGAHADGGITDFGRQAIKIMEQLDITVDVSHLNDEGFFQLCDIASKPFIATHSNCRAVCDVPRNLTDEQIKIIISGGGLVGINLYPEFIGKYKRSYEDVLRHIDRILSMGGENSLALGTDFDGAQMDRRFKGVESMPRFYNCIAKVFSTKTADKMFFENSYKFFAKYFDK